MKDLLRLVSEVSRSDDIIVLSNSDIAPSPSFTKRVIQTLREHDALYSRRRDFDCLDRSLTDSEVREGAVYEGNDLFAFRAEWWMRVDSEYPDFVFGAEGWDWTLRRLIQWRADSSAEFDDLV